MTKEQLEELKRIKAEQKAKGKPFKTMSTIEKWALLETIAKLLGLTE